MAVPSSALGRIEWLRQAVRARGSAAALALALAVPLSAGSAAAQATYGSFSITPKGGFTLPTGTLGSYTSSGPNVGLRLGYQITPSVALIAEGSKDFLRGNTLFQGNPVVNQLPDFDNLRLLGGVQMALTSEEIQPWSLVGTLAGGVSRLSTANFFSPGSGQTARFEETALTGGGGLELSYAITRQFALVVDGNIYYARIDEDRTQDLSSVRPTVLETFSSAVVVPVNIAFRTRF